MDGPWKLGQLHGKLSWNVPSFIKIIEAKRVVFIIHYQRVIRWNPSAVFVLWEPAWGLEAVQLHEGSHPSVHQEERRQRWDCCVAVCGELSPRALQIAPTFSQGCLWLDEVTCFLSFSMCLPPILVILKWHTKHNHLSSIYYLIRSFFLYSKHTKNPQPSPQSFQASSFESPVRSNRSFDELRALHQGGPGGTSGDPA